MPLIDSSLSELNTRNENNRPSLMSFEGKIKSITDVMFKIRLDERRTII